MLSTWTQRRRGEDPIPLMFARGSSPALEHDAGPPPESLAEQTLVLTIRREERTLFYLIAILMAVLFAVSATIASVT